MDRKLDGIALAVCTVAICLLAPLTATAHNFPGNGGEYGITIGPWTCQSATGIGGDWPPDPNFGDAWSVSITGTQPVTFSAHCKVEASGQQLWRKTVGVTAMGACTGDVTYGGKPLTDPNDWWRILLTLKATPVGAGPPGAGGPPPNGPPTPTGGQCHARLRQRPATYPPHIKCRDGKLRVTEHPYSRLHPI